MQPLMIEFIGLPGAGKTTIAQRVIAELTDAGYRCFGLSTLTSPEGITKKKGNLFQKLRTFYGLVLSSVLCRDIAVNAFLYTCRVRPLSFKSFQRLMVLLVRLDFVRTIMNEDFELVLLDQGLLQNIWSIATTGSIRENDKYLMRLTESVLNRFSPIVIGTRIEAAVAAERITQRRTKRSRFDTMPVEHTRPTLTRYSYVLAQIIDIVRNNNEKKLLDIDSGQPLDRNVNIILPFIERAQLVFPSEIEIQNEESITSISHM